MKVRLNGLRPLQEELHCWVLRERFTVWQVFEVW